MCKFSIIIPVYNTRAYLKDCLDSVLNQTMTDYEVIIVNDGSTDDSLEVIKPYLVNKKIKCLTQKNQGLSAARNSGVELAKGKYLLFLDSDDYLEQDLLAEISKNENEEDIIRFQIKDVDENKNIIKEYHENPFDAISGSEAIIKLITYHYVELACCYAFKKQFYVKNNLKFPVGFFHEDYGTIPLAILKARTVKSLAVIGYCYRNRIGSITTSNDYKKTKKRIADFHTLYLKNVADIQKMQINKNSEKYALSYLTNNMLFKLKSLTKEDQKIYLNKLNELNIVEYLVDDTIIRKTRKFIFKISPSLYLRSMR